MEGYFSDSRHSLQRIDGADYDLIRRARQPGEEVSESELETVVRRVLESE